MILEWLSSIREEIADNMPVESEIFEILGATSAFLNPRKEYVDSITIESKG